MTKNPPHWVKQSWMTDRPAVSEADVIAAKGCSTVDDMVLVDRQYLDNVIAHLKLGPLYASRQYAMGLELYLTAAPPAPANPPTDDGDDIGKLIAALRCPSGIGEPHDHSLMRQAAEMLAITNYGYRAIAAKNDELQSVISKQTAALAALSSKTSRAEVESSLGALVVAKEWIVGLVKTWVPANFSTINDDPRMVGINAVIRALADSHGRGE